LVDGGSGAVRLDVGAEWGLYWHSERSGVLYGNHINIVVLPGKEISMKNSRLIGGVILMLVAAGIFFFNVTDYSVPAAITLLIIGVALAATARRG